MQGTNTAINSVDVEALEPLITSTGREGSILSRLLMQSPYLVEGLFSGVIVITAGADGFVQPGSTTEKVEKAGLTLFNIMFPFIP